MIGPIKFDAGLYCGSRPQTKEDAKKLRGFTVIDLERRPVNGQCDFWFPLQSILPPMKFRVAAVLNLLSALQAADDEPVFIHCRTCRDRTPFIVAKWLILKGKPRVTALEFIKQFKPHWWLAWWRLFI